MPNSPFEREIERIATREARKLLASRRDLGVSYDDACAFSVRAARAIVDAWPKLAALRATYPKKAGSTRRESAVQFPPVAGNELADLPGEVLAQLSRQFRRNAGLST